MTPFFQAHRRTTIPVLLVLTIAACSPGTSRSTSAELRRLSRMQEDLRRSIANPSAGNPAPAVAAAPPTVPHGPARIGDVARQLSDRDIKELERMLPAGANPWLIVREQEQVSMIQSIQAFLAPDTTLRNHRGGFALCRSHVRGDP